MIYDNVLQAMGHTPLVRLNRLSEANAAQILVKFEGVNVGGSIKTRTALQMIESAERRGEIGPDSIMSEERRKLVRHYGAEVIVVHDAGDIGECISKCIALAKRMASEDPRVYVPQQFENRDNLLAHRYHTALEILEDVKGPIHGFCSGIGTGGTISGIGQALKRLFPDVCIWAVEPESAAILSGGSVGTHLQMGIGDGLIPDILDQGIYDDICVVSDEEAINEARALAREEGLLCGVSGGTNVVAARQLARQLGSGKTVVTLLPDTGERYFSTELFED